MPAYLFPTVPTISSGLPSSSYHTEGTLFLCLLPKSTVGISAIGAVSFIHHCAYPSMVGTQYCQCIIYLNGWKIEKTSRHRKFNPVRNNRPSVDFLIIILTASCLYLSTFSLRPWALEREGVWLSCSPHFPEPWQRQSQYLENTQQYLLSKLLNGFVFLHSDEWQFKSNRLFSRACRVGMRMRGKGLKVA